MYFLTDKFTLVSAKGKIDTPIMKTKRIGPFWNRRDDEVLSHTEVEDFSVSASDTEDIPDKKDCSEYQWRYEGQLKIANIYYYLKHIRFQDSPAPYVLINFVDHVAVDIDARCLSFTFVGEDVTPMADISFHEIGGKRKHGHQCWVAIKTTFSSRAHLEEYTASLEPEDTMILTKLRTA